MPDMQKRAITVLARYLHDERWEIIHRGIQVLFYNPDLDFQDEPSDENISKIFSKFIELGATSKEITEGFNSAPLSFRGIYKPGYSKFVMTWDGTNFDAFLEK